MNDQRLTAALVVASVVFGAIVAILAVTESSAMVTVAMIGGGVLAVAWCVHGVARSGMLRREPK